MSCKPACATCERLRERALEVVGAGGSEALSDEGLAGALGLSIAELRDHYATAAECLCETYDEIVDAGLDEMGDAFADSADFQSGLELWRRRSLERLAAHPDQTWLCFVETLRGDRELRRRRELGRRRIVELLAREHERDDESEELPPMQLEMLTGAIFHEIARSVAAGNARELEELEPKLAQMTGCFLPERV